MVAERDRDGAMVVVVEVTGTMVETLDLVGEMVESRGRDLVWVRMAVIVADLIPTLDLGWERDGKTETGEKMLEEKVDASGKMVSQESVVQR